MIFQKTTSQIMIIEICIVLLLLAKEPFIEAYSTNQNEMDNTSYLPNLNQAKLLRNDLINHKNYIDKMIKHLDDWVFIEIANITESDQLNESKYKLLETRISNMQYNITEMSLELSRDSDNDLGNLRMKANLLQDNLELLNQEIYDNKTRKNLQLIGEYFGNSNIINNYDNLSNEIAIIQHKIEEREDFTLPDECVKAIRKKQFTKVVHILNELKYENEIYYIVKKVYNNTENNFDLILQFGKVIRNKTQSFIVYKGLNNEMDLNDHNEDVNKILRFIKAFKTGIINQRNVDNTIKLEAQYLINHLKNKIKILGKNDLTYILSNNNSFILENSSLQKIFLLDDVLMADICKEVLLNVSLNMTNPKHALTQFKIILKELISAYIKNREILFKLSYFFKNISLNIDKFNIIIHNEVENLKKELPEFAKNLVFAERICIMNIGLNEYLHLSNETFDKNKYSVFTREININEEITIYDTWKMMRLYDNKYLIRNNGNNASSLYVENTKDDAYYKSTEGSSVYIWNNNDNTEHPVWEIDPYYCIHSCLIESSHPSGYLYANQESNHFAYINSIDLKHSDYWRWNFIDCSHVI